MPPVGFGPTISGGERPQIYALDSAATVTDIPTSIYDPKFSSFNFASTSRVRISSISFLLNVEKLKLFPRISQSAVSTAVHTYNAMKISHLVRKLG
jgi:hypothetical protein